MFKLIARVLVLLVFLFVLGGCSGSRDEEAGINFVETGTADQVPVEQPVQQQSLASEENGQTAKQQNMTSSPSNDLQTSEPEQLQDSSKAAESEAKTEPFAGPAVVKDYSLSVGGYFPPFNLAGLDGKQYQSVNVFSANQVTLVNFWATFCGPCIREMPALEQLRQNYQGRSLGLIGIVLDSKKADTARSMVTRLGTGYPHLLDDGWFGPYIYAVPQTFLVDNEGKILQAMTGAKSLQQFSDTVDPYLRH
ncbi:MAG: TlpA disulfide reductase family protein [Desulfotomaculaceae bacterium]|nr:TlpA disulfide reductase family protein [Desulfotomaculaceae bacterium]